MTNPFSLFSSIIYSLRLVGCLWLPSCFTHVGGTQIDYSWQGICFIGNGAKDVGIGASLRKLLGNKIPRGTLELPVSLPSVTLLMSCVYRPSLWIVNRSCHWARCLIILMGLFWPGPKIDGSMAVCCTYIYKVSFVFLPHILQVFLINFVGDVPSKISSANNIGSYKPTKKISKLWGRI